MSLRTGTEKTFYTSLKNLVKGQWVRIENAACHGTPDTHFTGLYTEIDTDKKIPVSAFIELKVCLVRPKPDKPLNTRFERGQIPWLVEHSQNYGSGIVAIRFHAPVTRFNEVVLIWATPLLPRLLELPFDTMIHQPTVRSYRLGTLGTDLPQFIHDRRNDVKPRWKQKTQRKPILYEGEEA